MASRRQPGPRRATKGPYSNTGPLSHFETKPTPQQVSAQLDFLGSAWDAVQPRPAPLFTYADPSPASGTDLRSMWAGNPVFRVEEPGQ